MTEDICATAIAITDADGTTILMMTLDFGTASEYVLQPVRERISAQLGIPQDRIYMHVTHTHSAPDFSQKDLPCIQRYSEKAREKCIKMGKPYGIRSQYHAWAIIRSQSFTPERGYLTINAVSVGEDFALVTYPGELFDSCGVRMEENSPYAMTMLFGYCHHHTFYLPSAAAFKYTSYETDCTFFQPGTGEQVADFQVQMLKELKNG